MVLVAEDVAHGGNHRHTGEWTDLLLDVYEPVGNTVPFRPAVIWVHGGGFANGNKRSVTPLPAGSMGFPSLRSRRW